MIAETLGHVPGLSRLSLIDGQDFFDTLTVASPLPVGSVVTIECMNRDKTIIYGSWPLTLVGSAYEIRIDSTDHANVIAGSWFRLWVTYPSGGGRICWLAGPVERNKR